MLMRNCKTRTRWHGRNGKMIPKYQRRDVSASARRALSISIFSAMLFVVSGVLHRFDAINTPHFLEILALVLLTAIVSLVLAAAGFRALWAYGSIGGKRSALAVIISGLVLAPFGVAAYSAAVLPKISDISTDLADPPAFSNGSPSRLKPALQQSAYPAVTGRRYALSSDRIVPLIDKLAAQSGWQILNRSGDLNETGELVIEARARTFVLGFSDFVVIRATDEGDTIFVDMRSRSGFGGYDLGANAKRIVTFMQELDALTASLPAG